MLPGSVDAAGAAGSDRAQAGAVVVRVDAGARAGAVVPSDFLGLSLETPALHLPPIESHSSELSHLLAGLGTGVLRVSGDSVDRTQWLPSPGPPAPWSITTLTPADLQNLAALTNTTGWHVILGIDLGHPMPAAAVEEALAARSILGSSLAGVAIGNEPDLYTRPPPALFRALLGSRALRSRGWDLAEYETELATIQKAIVSAGVSLPSYGPESATTQWFDGYAAEEHPGQSVLTTHLYPLDRCHAGRLASPGPSTASLLARAVAVRESTQIRSLVRAAAGRGLPLRLDELNSVACGGEPGTSNTFAAALWAIDVSLIAADEGVAGVNFTSGLGGCQQGGTFLSPWYSPLCTLPDGQLAARPEYYALLLLHSLENCSFIPLSYESSRDISLFALRAPGGSLRFVIDDMENSSRSPAASGQKPTPLAVTLDAGTSYHRANVMRLTAPGIGALDGVTLGGASLSSDGTLAPPALEPLRARAGSVHLQVKPGSVALVTLSR